MARKRKKKQNPAKTDNAQPEATSAPDEANGDVREWCIAAGLGLVLLARPWIDGVTFVERNVWFVWGVLIVAVLYAVRPLLGREPMRFTTPTILLGAFLAVALATSWVGIEWARSHQYLTMWASYALLFVVITNAIRSRTAVVILIGFFVATSMAETIYSFFHLQFVMPTMRRALMDDPMAVRQYFGGSELTPELIREGYAQDLKRFVQDRRRSLECQYTDRIRVGIETESDEVWTAVEENLQFLKNETLAIDIANNRIPDAEPVDCEIAGSDVRIYVKVAP